MKNIISDQITERKTVFWSIVLILCITFAVYVNSLPNDFTNWDDDDLIVNNNQIRSLSLNSIKEIFDYTSTGTYQPVRVLSYAIDYHFWQLNPMGYHIHNILLHSFAAVFLYLFLLAGIPHIKGMNNLNSRSVQYIAVFSALFFAVHPINVESVTWLSGRKYVLLTFFSFLSLFLFVKNSVGEKFSVWLLAGALFASFLAVFSSPFGVILPALFFLYDFCKDKSNNPILVLKKQLYHYIPYIVFALIVIPKLWVVLIEGAAKEHFQGDPFNTFLGMLIVLFNYFRNLLVPLWLNARYPDQILLNGFNYKIFCVIGIIILSVIYAIMKVRRSDKITFFCGSWFLISWLPASNIIPISTRMADRYIYIASVGFFLWVVMIVFYYGDKLKVQYIGCIFLSLLILIYGGLTIKRNTVWESSITLWHDSVKKNPNNVLALINLGAAYYEKKNYKQSIKYSYAATLIQPEHEAAHGNLAASYIEDGQLKKAEKELIKSIQISPDRLVLYETLGKKVYEELGLYNKALEIYKKAIINTQGDDGRLYYDVASLYAADGEYQKAISYYHKALNKKNNFPEGCYDLGRAFHSIGKLEKAEEFYRKAIMIREDYPEPYNSLGNIMLQKGSFEEAKKNYEKALEIKPAYPEVYYNMGNGYLLNNNLGKALESFRKSLQIDSEYIEAKQMIRQIEHLLNTKNPN